MTGMEIFFLVFAVLGGLALFIFGMNVMTDGLRQAVGSHLRTILSKTARNRFSGIALGTVLGFLVHSSATTVMLVGFVNAGLMTLAEAIPPMLGANIGTTFSMQLISFKLDEYCFFAITLGFILQMACPRTRGKQIGRALLGFGLLFLGMKTMSGAIKPYREVLAPFLSNINGSHLGGMLLGVLISTAITGIIQSSGAMIGMCYALISAGVFTELAQVYPIVLGAHIGTCCTAMLGSIGTNIQARRTAVSHLVFNIVNVIMAIVAAPFFFWLVPLTTADLIHQTANLHTLVIGIAALIILPVSHLHARLVTMILRTRKPLPQPSFLDNSLINRPEKAIYAAIRELRRVTQICCQSLRLNAELFFETDRKVVQAVKLNEQIVNEIKLAMKDYVTAMTHRHLSRRQSILIQHVDRCMTDIERIGDHIDELADLSIMRQKIPEALFDVESFERFFSLYESSLGVLKIVIESLDPENKDFQKMAENILKMRDEYMEKSIDIKAMFVRKMAERKMAPIAGIFFSEYQATLDRIVRHSKIIALAESQPEFWIKRKKLDRKVDQAPKYELPPRVDPHDFLDQLQSEDYL